MAMMYLIHKAKSYSKGTFSVIEWLTDHDHVNLGLAPHKGYQPKTTLSLLSSVVQISKAFY